MTQGPDDQPGWQRVGLLGGTFDPPHLAHRALADCALQHLQLDRVLWIPAGQPWQKSHRLITAAQHRCAMVRLLIHGQARFELDEREIHRPGPSTTIHTLQELSLEHPQTRWVLILGQDQYARLDTWRQWEEVVSRVVLAVAPRDGEPVRPAPALREWMQRHPQACSTAELPMTLQPISSTAVRTQRQAGGDVAALVGAAVARYIDEHRLYTGTP